jgi:hypothetical protein
MFVASPNRQGVDTPPSGPSIHESPGRQRDLSSLALLAERTRPVSSSQTRLIPVLAPLAELLPDGALRRGSTILVTGSSAGGGGGGGGDISMALALLAAASGAGSWCALVGVDDLGAVAAHDMGIDLGRLAVVPRPGAAWAETASLLLGGVDLVVLRPPFRPRPAMARKLVARTRERRSVLVIVPGRSGWPDPPDIRLSIDDLRWEGAGSGEGYLSGRLMTLTATGRRASARPRRHHLWLPSAAGTVAGADGDDGITDTVVPA